MSPYVYKNTFTSMKLPVDERTLVHYLSDHAEILSVATLYRRLASINKAHRMMKHPSPTKAEAVKLTMRGIMREHGKAQRRVKPLTKDDLIAIFSHMDDSVKDKRDMMANLSRLKW